MYLRFCAVSYLWFVKKGKAIRVQAWTSPEVSRKLRFPDFLDNRHMKVVPLVLISVRLSRPQDHSAAGSIKSMTPTGMEPTTFQLAAQCLNQLRHHVPPIDL